MTPVLLGHRAADWVVALFGLQMDEGVSHETN